MGKIKLIYFLFGFVFIGCASIPNDYIKVSENIYVKNDEFKGNSFYQHKITFPPLVDMSKPIEIYIGKKQKEKWMRIIFQYYGGSWIFFEQAAILDSHGNKLEFTFPSYAKVTEVISGGVVYEKIDLPFPEEKIKVLESILISAEPKIKIRLSGKYYKDYELDKDTMLALKEMLSFYKTVE